MKRVNKLRFRLGSSTRLHSAGKHTVVQVSWVSAIARIMAVLVAVILTPELTDRAISAYAHGLAPNAQSIVQAAAFLLLVTPMLYLAFVGPLLSHVSDRVQAEDALRVSEARFRNIFDGSPIGIELYDSAGRLLHANKACLEIFGIEDEQEILGFKLFDDPNLSDDMKLALRHGKTVEYRAPFDFDKVREQALYSTTRSGLAFLHVIISLISLSENGSHLGYMIQVQDATEQHMDQEERLRSERQFRTVFESMSEGLALHDVIYGPDGSPVNYVITDVNPQYEAIVGLSRDSVVGKLATEAYGTPEPPYLHEFASVARTNTARSLETYFPPMDKHFVISIVPFGPARFATIFFDVTARKKTEAALKASEANYRAIFDAASDAILVQDTETGNILDANRRSCEMFGYTRRELKTRSIGELSPDEAPYTQADAMRWIRKVSKGKSQLFEWKHKDKSGRLFWVEVNLKEASIGGRNIVMAVVRDISERKQVEEALAVRAFWEGIASTMQNGLVVISTNGSISYVNDSFCKLVGRDRSQLIGELPPYSWWVQEPDGRVPGGIFTTDELRNHNGFVLRRDGKRVPVLVNMSNLRDAEGALLSRFAVLQDISSLVAMEEQLVRRERLAMLGQLAGSIGHEIRNPLGVIRSSVYYLRSKLANTDEKIERHLERLDNSVAFSDKVITDLLSFARIPKLYRNPMDLDGFIRKMLEEFSLAEGIEVSVSATDDATVPADETQMTQLFRNLIANGLDAMTDDGRLDIGICRTDHHVEVAICDTGTGIPEEDLEKVFEPLYSTKARGAGFGLAICKKIVESHGGTIILQSSLGKGTRVVVSLPIIREDRNG